MTKVQKVFFYIFIAIIFCEAMIKDMLPVVGLFLFLMAVVWWPCWKYVDRKHKMISKAIMARKIKTSKN